jgi:succinate dehydrogenase/fumarate reductase flavoprotein subunit
MKKLFLVLFVALLVFGLSFNADASTKAKIATMEKSPTPPGAISDADSGDCAEVDTEGRIYTRDMGGHTVASQYGDGIVYTGECVVYSVTIQSVAADAYATVYDALSATGTAKADPQIPTAKSFDTQNLGGAHFATGIYVNATGGTGIVNSDALVTVVYDPL